MTRYLSAVLKSYQVNYEICDEISAKLTETKGWILNRYSGFYCLLLKNGEQLIAAIALKKDSVSSLEKIQAHIILDAQLRSSIANICSTIREVYQEASIQVTPLPLDSEGELVLTEAILQVSVGAAISKIDMTASLIRHLDKCRQSLVSCFSQRYSENSLSVEEKKNIEVLSKLVLNYHELKKWVAQRIPLSTINEYKLDLKLGIFSNKNLKPLEIMRNTPEELVLAQLDLLLVKPEDFARALESAKNKISFMLSRYEQELENKNSQHARKWSDYLTYPKNFLYNHSFIGLGAESFLLLGKALPVRYLQTTISAVKKLARRCINGAKVLLPEEYTEMGERRVEQAFRHITPENCLKVAGGAVGASYSLWITPYYLVKSMFLTACAEQIKKALSNYYIDQNNASIVFPWMSSKGSWLFILNFFSSLAESYTYQDLGYMLNFLGGSIMNFSAIQSAKKLGLDFNPLEPEIEKLLALTIIGIIGYELGTGVARSLHSQYHLRRNCSIVRQKFLDSARNQKGVIDPEAECEISLFDKVIFDSKKPLQVNWISSNGTFFTSRCTVPEVALQQEGFYIVCDEPRVKPLPRPLPYDTSFAR